MDLPLIVLLVAVLLAIGLLVPALALYLTTRLWRVERATFRTALKITIFQWLVLLVLAPGLGIALNAGPGLLSVAAGLPLFFIVFHWLLKRYYGTGFGKNIGIYVVATVFTLVLTRAVLLPVRFSFENYTIAGSNMEPNLHHRQYVMVDKLAYRRLYPVQRGDIIVFRFPRAPQYHFIGRVIGLPGEVIEIRDGIVFIDDSPLIEPYIENRDDSNFASTQMELREYFILGDNRPNASDSRVWGPLPEDRIIGRVWQSYWPPAYWGPINRPHYSYAP